MLPPSVQIYFCTTPMDMRRSFDGLAYAVEQELQRDPRSGGLFVFVNKRFNRAKVLWWDKNGYCMLYKRLHQARFVAPDATSDQVRVRIDVRELQTLLVGVATEKKRRHLKK